MIRFLQIIQYVACSFGEQEIHAIYGLMTILACAFLYATLFSMIAIITGESVFEVYWALFKISLPIGLLVGYNAWAFQNPNLQSVRRDVGQIGVDQGIDIDIEMTNQRYDIPPVF